MSWKHIFAKKDLELLLAEMAGEHRLHRVLGPISLTALGIGCIIGAGIFVLTGVAAADYAGPSIIISFAVAALGCAFAAMCYAEFAAMAPVAGSVYTYTYTTLGEIFAWIIGWDLILEYSMGCATVASAWAHYLNKLLASLFGEAWTLSDRICYDPFTDLPGTTAHAWFNVPAVLIMIAVTMVLVLGIKESARTNAILVMIKIVVVFFVIFAGWSYTKSSNWTSIPVTDRVLPQERAIPDLVKHLLKDESPGPAKEEESKRLEKQLAATYRWEWIQEETKRLQSINRMNQTEAAEIVSAAKRKLAPNLPASDSERKLVESLLPGLREEGEKKAMSHWGLLGEMGLNRWLAPVDDAVRSPFAPYGFSGIMLGASIVFFAFIGFDSISTHAEEAKKPQRDVPIGIITSLLLCTVLYIIVAAVITGMVPYPEININAPIAAAFTDRAKEDQSMALRVSGGLIAAGGLAGMTSVLLVLFLSQARVFMAMARDGLLPKVFGTVHPKFRTPHIATMLTGAVICVVAAFTPIEELAKMVNIGTLLAFVMVCSSVMILRIRRPEAKRPFRCPLLFVFAPLGIMVNLAMMLFLPVETWWRLLIWLGIGMAIYFGYSRWHSHLALHLMREIQTPLSDEPEETGGTT